MAKNVAQSPLERSSLAPFDQRLTMAKRCAHGTYKLQYVHIYISFKSIIIISVQLSHNNNA